jgi:hypothetical protein
MKRGSQASWPDMGGRDREGLWILREKIFWRRDGKELVSLWIHL